MFSRSNSRHRSMSSELPVVADSAAVCYPEEMQQCRQMPPKEYLEFTPKRNGQLVGSHSESDRYAGVTRRPLQPVGSASTEIQKTQPISRSRADQPSVGTLPGQNSNFESQVHRQDSHRHVSNHGRRIVGDQLKQHSNTGLPETWSQGSKQPLSDNTMIPDGKPQTAPRRYPSVNTRPHDGRPQAAPRQSPSDTRSPDGRPQVRCRHPPVNITRQKLPEAPYDVGSTERENSVSPEPHLYEMDSFNTEVPSPRNAVLTRQPQVGSSAVLQKSMSYDKEGEFAPMDGKEGEFDNRYDTPTKPVPASRRSVNSNYRPVATPRKKKATSFEHEYLELDPKKDEKRTEQERKHQYLKDLNDLGAVNLNPQVNSLSADQLKKFLYMLQENSPEGDSIRNSQGNGTHSQAGKLFSLQGLVSLCGFICGCVLKLYTRV